MRLRWFLPTLLCAVLPLVVLAQAALPAGSSSSSGAFPRADQDIRGNAFVANNRDLDGGAGLFSFVSNTDSCMKPGAYSSAYFCAENDRIKFYETVWTPTLIMQAPQCDSNLNCRLEATTGYWFGFKPQADLTNCTTGSEGGLKPYSTDHTLRYCDGTTVQRVGFVLSNTATIDFASMNAQTTDSQTMTITGATTADAVFCTPVLGGTMSGTDMHPTVTAADTVTIVAHNDTNGTVDPPSMSIKCVIVR